MTLILLNSKLLNSPLNGKIIIDPTKVFQSTLVCIDLDRIMSVKFSIGKTFDQF